MVQEQSGRPDPDVVPIARPVARPDLPVERITQVIEDDGFRHVDLAEPLDLGPLGESG